MSVADTVVATSGENYHAVYVRVRSLRATHSIRGFNVVACIVTSLCYRLRHSSIRRYAEIAKLFIEMDAATPKAPKGDIPLKLVGRSGALVETLFYGVGKDAKKFDSIVKQLEVRPPTRPLASSTSHSVPPPSRGPTPPCISSPLCCRDSSRSSRGAASSSSASSRRPTTGAVL